MTVFYYTATGNSLTVAKHIGGNLISIPQIIDSENLSFKDDVIGIVFPIYSLSTPKMVNEFLNKVKFEAEYIFAIGTYGKIDGACMFSLQKIAKNNGYHFDYLNSLLMLDNYLPIFDIDKEILKLPSKKIDEMLGKIVNDICNRKQLVKETSIVMKFFTNALSGLNSHVKAYKNYTVNEKCTKCGVCQKVCLAKNIDIKDTINFNDHCESCFACLHNCPQNAIHIKNEKSSKRFRNPEISLLDIINSNNRY